MDSHIIERKQRTREERKKLRLQLCYLSNNCTECKKDCNVCPIRKDMDNVLKELNDYSIKKGMNKKDSKSLTSMLQRIATKEKIDYYFPKILEMVNKGYNAQYISLELKLSRDTINRYMKIKTGMRLQEYCKQSRG